MDIRPPSQQKGITLVELLIAMMIALFMTTGLIQIFLSNRQTYQIQKAIATIQDNARFLNAYLARELRMSGYLGCNAGVAVTNLLNSTTNSWDFSAFGAGLSAHRHVAGGSPDWQPALAGSLGFTPATHSDVIFIRRMGDTPLTLDNGDITLSGNPSAADTGLDLADVDLFDFFSEGGIYFVSNCHDSAVVLQFCKDQVTGSAGSESYAFKLKDCASDYQPGNGSDVQHLVDKEMFRQGAQISSLKSTAFYVRDTNGVGELTVVHYTLGGASNPSGETIEAEDPVLRGISNLRYEFAVQTNYDSNFPTRTPVYRFSSPENIGSAEWRHVRSVRISYTLSAGSGDSLVERNFTTLVNLRNLQPNTIYHST